MFCFAAVVNRGLLKSGKWARNPADAFSNEFRRTIVAVNQVENVWALCYYSIVQQGPVNTGMTSLLPEELRPGFWSESRDLIFEYADGQVAEEFLFRRW
jgi:hypothetical protein